MQHIIKKQVIELEIDHQLDAYAIQQQVSEWYWHHFLSLLENEFAKLSDPGEVHTIDRLEIDLGVIDISQLQKTQLHKVVLPAITQQIQARINNGQTATSITTKRTGTQHSFTQWLLYMQKGSLPWNVLQITSEWLQEVLKQLATDHHSVTLLCNEIRNNDTVCMRIVQQHTPTWLAQLITVLTATGQSKLPETVVEIEKLFIRLHEDKAAGVQNVQIATRSRKQIWQQVLHRVATAPQKLTTTQLATKIVQEFITPAQMPVLEKIHQQYATEYPQLHPVLTTVQQQLQQSAAAHLKHSPSSDVTNDPDRSGNGENQQRTPGTTQKLLKEEDGLFVQHAGLVLIHPFLRSLFSLCGLLEGREFSSPVNQQKAICLLHYIATGSVTAEEHELVIPKILCNYPVEGIVDTDTTLSINELQEADDLTRAAIAQWSILKNTSPDGLRQGFLQRNGKLFTKNEQLYIEVEKNTIDVLLDHLPWNLSLIKLPWSGNIIRVEWR